MIDLYQSYRQMLPNSISLTFKGVASEGLIDSMINLIANKLDEVENDYQTKKKVYSVLVECLQNIYRYVDKEGWEMDNPNNNYDKSSSVFAINSDSQGYQIATANFVAPERKEPLKEWLEEINQAPDKELKKMYNKILLNKEFNDKGGAGLGMIEIARKSGNRIEYNFDPIDNKSYFFCLKVKVNKN